MRLKRIKEQGEIQDNCNYLLKTLDDKYSVSSRIYKARDEIVFLKNDREANNKRDSIALFAECKEIYLILPEEG